MLPKRVARRHVVQRGVLVGGIRHEAHATDQRATEALDDLAEIIFEEVKVRRQIETDRAKPRTQVRIVAIATLVVLAALPFLGTYTAAYATPLGQVLLTIWVVLFGLLLMWMRSISIGKPAPRLLVAPETKEDAL